MFCKFRITSISRRYMEIFVETFTSILNLSSSSLRSLFVFILYNVILVSTVWYVSQFPGMHLFLITWGNNFLHRVKNSRINYLLYIASKLIFSLLLCKWHFLPTASFIIYVREYFFSYRSKFFLQTIPKLCLKYCYTNIIQN